MIFGALTPRYATEDGLYSGKRNSRFRLSRVSSVGAIPFDTAARRASYSGNRRSQLRLSRVGARPIAPLHLGCHFDGIGNHTISFLKPVLQVVQARVEPALGEQFLVAPLLPNLALVDD